MSSRVISAFASGASLLIASMMQPAVAQSTDQPAASGGGGIEEIVVTARRREEKLQSVPVDVTAFTPADIREKQIYSVTQLEYQEPALSLNPFTGINSSNQIHIRGLPGVVTYFAQAPVTGVSGQPTLGGLGLFYDLENVQVLLGPQGTLFGLNATGGAVLREPKKPSNDYEGYIQATLGEYDEQQVEAAVNVPIVDDKLLVRLATNREARDGTTSYLHTNLRTDDRNDWDYRVAVTFRPVDWLENYIVYDGNREGEHGGSYVLKAVNPTGFPAEIFGLKTLDAELAQQNALGARTIIGASFPDTYLNQKTNMVVDNLRIDLTDDLAFRNIASWSSLEQAQDYNFDGSPLSILDYFTPNENYGAATESETEEFQLQGNTRGGKLNYQIGGFLSFTHIPDPSFSCAGFENFGALPNCNKLRNAERTQAVYSQASYDLGDVWDALAGLNATAGIRYNWDFARTWTQGANHVAGGPCPLSGADKNCVTVQSDRWHSPGWTFALDYKLYPDTLVYGTLRKAYSAGGFNSASLPAQLQTYQPEYIIDAEIGIKSDWELYGVKARTNLSLFRDWYDNIQELTTAVYVDPQGITRSTGVNLNAAKAKIEGADLQLTIVPDKSFDFNMNYEYIMAKYIQFITTDPVTFKPLDLSSQGFLFTPKHKGSVTGRYHLPIDPDWGTAFVAATITARTSMNLLADGSPYGVVAPIWQLDLRSEWNDIFGYPLDLAAYVTNVTNKLYPIATVNTYFSLGTVSLQYAEPRLYGFQLRYRFGPGLKSGLGLF